MIFTTQTVLFSFIIVLVVTDIGTGQAIDKQKLRETAMGMVKECQKSVGASEDDVQMLIDKKMPTTREGVCMIECVFSNANILTNGKINKDGAVIALTPALGGDATKIEKMKSMLDVCEKEIGDGNGDKCDMAKMFVDCTMKHGQEYGFEFPTHA